MMFAKHSKSLHLASFELPHTVPSKLSLIRYITTVRNLTRSCSLKLYAQSVPQSSGKLAKLKSFLKKHPGPTLIYVTMQKVRLVTSM